MGTARACRIAIIDRCGVEQESLVPAALPVREFGSYF
jgi:hypothetical protein